MSRWFDALPGVTGARELTPQALAGWPDRAMDDRLSRLSWCPVAQSELYTIAQHLPLVVLHTPHGPELAADLRRDTVQRPPFDANGRFTLPYRPIALRQLPFIVDADGAIRRLADSLQAEDTPRPAELQKRLVSMLAAQVDGRQRFARAITAGREAGLIAPAPGDAPDGAPLEATALIGTDDPPACDDPLALRLAAVMLFSQRNRRNPTAILAPGSRARLSLVRDDALRDRPFMLDEQPIDFAALFGPRTEDADDVARLKVPEGEAP